jgi:hypothetical protein
VPDTGFGFASFLPADGWGVVQNAMALVVVVYMQFYKYSLLLVES